MNTEKQINIISNYQKLLVKRFHSQTTIIAQLTAAGCINAKEYWKDGKYLYLLYAMKNGSRKKKYIGNHPLRIKEARQKLENYQLRLVAISTQDEISTEMDEIEFLINRILRICSITSMSALEDCGMGTNQFPAGADHAELCTQYNMI